MKYSYEKWKTCILLTILTSDLVYIDGRRYDKCETPDGREGVCVVKRYCRERTVQPLLQCDDNINFCCPIPTAEDSLAPAPPQPASNPISGDSFDNQRTAHSFDNQRTHHGTELNPVRTYIQSDRGTEVIIPEDGYSAQEQAQSSEKRIDSTRRHPPKPQSDYDIKEENHPRPRGNRRTDIRFEEPLPPETPKYDSVPQIDEDIKKTYSGTRGNRRSDSRGVEEPIRQETPKYASRPRIEEDIEQTYNRPGENRRTDSRVEESIPREAPKYDSRSRFEDEIKETYHRPQTNRRTDSHASRPRTEDDIKEIYPRPDGNRRTGIRVEESIPQDTSKHPSGPRIEEDIKQTHSQSGGNRRTDSRGVEETISQETPKYDSRNDGEVRETYPRPGPNRRTDSRESITPVRPKYEDSVSHTINKPNTTQEKSRRVLFPDPDEYFPRPHQILPPHSENPSGMRHGVRIPEKSKTDDRNDRTMEDDLPMVRPPIGHYPARDQLEIQKLPSNPRRLKPLRYDTTNETDDISGHHSFLSPESLTPKVPSCGVKPYDLFIAGGETSQPFEWPWMTSIFRRHQGSKPKTFICGGSLINNKYVLTAAHCFVNNYVILPASSFIIRVGSNYLDSGEEYTVESLVVHHNHSGSDFFNDIALIRVASEVYVTDKIAPICLPPPNMMLQDLVGRLATVAGWGDTTFRTGASRALQHVTVPIVSSEECFAAYSRVRGAAFLARGSDHVICAGLREGGKDACLGDSGGPLMLKTIDDRWTIVGIVSLGYKCAEPGYPGVYTRVTHYLSWIEDNMKLH